MTPADVYFGRQYEVLTESTKIMLDDAPTTLEDSARSRLRQVVWNRDCRIAPRYKPMRILMTPFGDEQPRSHNGNPTMNMKKLIVTRLATALILSGLVALDAAASGIGKVDP